MEWKVFSVCLAGNSQHIFMYFIIADREAPVSVLPEAGAEMERLGGDFDRVFKGAEPRAPSSQLSMNSSPTGALLNGRKIT
jgi:hypothetical protein